MGDVIRGRFVWQKTKTGRERRVIYPTKKGTSQPTFFTPERLAPTLKDRMEDEIEIDLELDKGLPIRIRPAGESWAKPQSTVSRSTNNESESKDRFHNPYNFVPAPPRTNITGGLGDGEPAGHHRFLPDHISGAIRVKLTTETPLLLPDAARVIECQENVPALGITMGHKAFPVRVDAEQKPYLPSTSIKGMLRAAYEAATNSRLAVFQGWDRRLAFRRQAKVEVEPARVIRAANASIEIRILSQRWMKSPAKLPRYLQQAPPSDRRKGEKKAALRYPDGSLPDHQDRVWVRVGDNGSVAAIQRYGADAPGNDWWEGWVLVTEPNINNKKAERVFVISDDDEFVTARGTEAVSLHQLWTDLIRDYQLAHQRDLAQREQRNEQPNVYLGNSPGQTAWSRHVYDPEATRLVSGTLCYVRREKGQITGLYPVSISRDLFPVSPRSLVPESLLPSSSLTQLSPADRVFGWVNQNGQGAYRGHVRVGPVCCGTSDPVEKLDSPDSPGLPLAILGEPKPQQSRFYVAKSTNGAAQAGGFPKEEGYRANKGLRGRKVFPHHRALPPHHWEEPTEERTQQATNGHFQEYRRPKLKNKEQRDTQNRSIQGWIKPKTEFFFDLHVTNLSAVELGGLLWLLSMGEGHFHRLGGGKPLGFGSVRLTIDPEKTHLHTGASWKWFYSTLDDTSQDEANRTQLIESFQKAVVDAYAPDTQGRLAERFERVPFIAAFLRAARGFDDDLPIHYPRARQPGQSGLVPPHPEGKAYEWFVANDRKGKQGDPRLCLPDLTNDAGLPVLRAT